MTIEKTMFIIKPDGYKNKDKIIEEITNDGRFKIISTADTILTEKLAQEFYSGEEEPLLSALSKYVSSGNIYSGVIEGNDVIQSFFDLCGSYGNPNKCDKNTLRSKYGSVDAVLYDNTPVFHNAIHRSEGDEANKDLELYWSKIKHPQIIKEIDEIVINNLDSEDRYKYHIIPVVNNGRKLASELNVEPSIIEIACYLHDITRMQGDIENHHITGAEFAEKYLSSINYPEEKKDLIYNCILNHRGSVRKDQNTIEEMIVSSADAMAIISYSIPLFYSAFNKRSLNITEGKEFIKNKLKRSWDKINLDVAKEYVRDDYNNVMRILNND